MTHLVWIDVPQANYEGVQLYIPATAGIHGAQSGPMQ